MQQSWDRNANRAIHLPLTCCPPAEREKQSPSAHTWERWRKPAKLKCLAGWKADVLGHTGREQEAATTSRVGMHKGPAEALPHLPRDTQISGQVSNHLLVNTNPSCIDFNRTNNSQQPHKTQLIFKYLWPEKNLFISILEHNWKSQEKVILGCHYLDVNPNFADGLAESLGAFSLLSASGPEVLLL